MVYCRFSTVFLLAIGVTQGARGLGAEPPFKAILHRDILGLQEGSWLGFFIRKLQQSLFHCVSPITVCLRQFIGLLLGEGFSSRFGFSFGVDASSGLTRADSGQFMFFDLQIVDSK